MATGYTVTHYKILRPTKTVAERFRISEEELYPKDKVEFISAMKMFKSKTGRGLIIGLPELLTTETIVYDDTAAILRMSDTYKELIEIMPEEDIMRMYLPSVVSVDNDGWEAAIFKRSQKGEWVRLDETVKSTGDIPVYVSEELGFYVKPIRTFGKCIFNKLISAHSDFKGSGPEYDADIYAYAPDHFKALISCLKDGYKGKRHTLDNVWRSICIGHNFLEVTF